MFDWNDEEITNIIWGEGGESGDHIVPYPDGSEDKSSGLYGEKNRKDRNEGAANAKPDEQKKPPSGTHFHEVKLEGSSQHETNESLPVQELGMKSWPAKSLSNSAKTDQDSTRTDLSNNLTANPKDEPSRHAGETAQLDKSSEIFQNQQDREQGDYVDYGWSNIGSFDDFDRIFSNDDPIFGHASLSNVDELWSPSKDVTSSPEKSIPLPFDSPSLAGGALRSSLDQFGVKSEHVLDQDPFGSDCGKMTNVTSNTPQNVQACSDMMGYAGGDTKRSQKQKRAIEAPGKIPIFNEQLSAGVISVPDKLFSCVQGIRKKRLLKPQVKSEEKSEVRQLQDICGTWSTTRNQLQEFDSQYAPVMGQPYPALAMSQQRQLLGPESSQYKHLPGPLLASAMYANMPTQYPPMAAMSQLPSGHGNNQKMITGYEVSPPNSDPLKKLSYASSQPLPMTPQEKIEKLRRRQQMRAMLAIQKQQQQFNNQVSCMEPPIMEGTSSNVERNLYMLSSIDPSSPVEQEDSCTICSPPDDSSVEESILHRLQDVIMKLDFRIRLCIRDSLFRLAQSAAQRQISSDTCSTNRSGRDEAFKKEERNSQNRFGRMPDVETETNPIDRTVAHLLFHRPPELLGKHTETPGSPLPAKLLCERNAADLLSLPRTVLPQSSESEKMHSHDEPKVSFLFPEGDESKDSTCLDTSQNLSNNEAADGAVLGVEASK